MPPPDLLPRLSQALAGRYELEREIGAGGMATVYLARDPKHERPVAIKVLRPELTASLGAERFLREIRVAAQLAHPHIVSLIDSGEVDGLLYYVMPYVDGESLRTRLTRTGALPVALAVRVLRDVADALAYAHAHGVVHRDVKPENVMLSGRHALVLDFGVAKALSEATGLSNLTGTGLALGTPAYMAPEQAAGDPSADHRADLYALGVLGYEMLTGSAPFAGHSAQALLAAHASQTPEALSAHRRGVPAELNALVMRCLEKDPADRWPSATAILDRLESLPTTEEPPTSRRRRASRLGIAAAVLLTLLGAVLLVKRNVLDRNHLNPTLVQATFRAGVQQYPAWSPDGTRLAYTGDAGSVRKIYVKRLDTGTEAPLTSGPYDDLQPAWSPDGRTILFVRAQRSGVRLEPGDVFGQYDSADVWAADVGSGAATKLVADAFDPSYSPDGKRIAVDASWAGPRRIWTVDREGHNPSQITADTSETVVHTRPHWSPNGKAIVFQNIERTNFNVRVVDLGSQHTTAVTTGLFQDLNPVWSPTGRLIYFSSFRSGGLNLWRVRVGSGGVPSEPPQQVTNGGGQDVDAAVAPDGNRVAFAILKQNADIWRLPVSPSTGEPTGPPQPLIQTTREDSRGAWSSDGRRIAFNSDRNGQMNIWLYDMADGATRQLTQGPGGDFQPNWSPDGKRIAFFSSRAGSVDIWLVDLASGQLTRLTHSSGVAINPFFSPDGAHIAYQADPTGRLELWMMNADGSDAHQLARTGVRGHFMRWTRDGGGVVFRCQCGTTPHWAQVSLGGGEPEALPDMAGGAHLSYNPDHSRIMDVVGHKTLWTSSVVNGKPVKIFAFDDPDVRIDYPVWSPDGKSVLFDRFRPEGGDIWVLGGMDGR